MLNPKRVRMRHQNLLAKVGFAPPTPAVSPHEDGFEATPAVSTNEGFAVSAAGFFLGSSPRQGEDAVEQAEIRLHVGTGLAKLSAEEREILDLRYFEGLRPHEVGRRLGITANAASQREGRARKKLGKMLEKHYGKAHE